jgi:DNA helicase-2/ATP-dependent DNA helicase PcrA
LQVLENIPEVLDCYQEKYKYLMVDEYQDTNIPQYKIIQLLASRYKNIAVVGDDWQSIYSWR